MYTQLKLLVDQPAATVKPEEQRNPALWNATWVARATWAGTAWQAVKDRLPATMLDATYVTGPRYEAQRVGLVKHIEHDEAVTVDGRQYVERKLYWPAQVLVASVPLYVYVVDNGDVDCAVFVRVPDFMRLKVAVPGGEEWRMPVSKKPVALRREDVEVECWPWAATSAWMTEWQDRIDGVCMAAYGVWQPDQQLSQLIGSEVWQ